MIRPHLSRIVALAAVAAAVTLAASTQASAATSGTFTATGSMNATHTHGKATLLPDGQVLVTGDANPPELYNPATGTWAVTGQMNTPRTDSTATLLPDGQVLVAGGTSDTGTFALSSAELYNPATGTWSVTGSMRDGRSGLDGLDQSATLLPDGEVLVAGGEDANFNALSSAELYNPATGTWSKTGNMTSAFSSPTATLLNNGQVLMAGPVSDLYNPATGKFTQTGAMTGAVAIETATLLPNGDVLGTEKGQNFAQVYDPATGTWSDASGGMGPCQGLQECRMYSSATLLPDGDVLVAGGLVGLVQNPQTTPTAILYNPDTSTWTTTGSMTTGREGQTATPLPDGQVLMAGGTLYDHPSGGHPGITKFLSSAELYTP